MNTEKKLSSLLFYSDEPISKKNLSKYLDVEELKLDSIALEINSKINSLGLNILFDESVMQMTTTEDTSDYVNQFFKMSPQSLSKPSLEVLSIIAINQPISKDEIDLMRGVSSEQTIKNLINLKMIDSKIENNQTLYITTIEFLKKTGLKTVAELKKIIKEDKPRDAKTK